MESRSDKRIAYDKLFNFRPVFFAAVFLCLGIVYAYLRAKTDCSPWWLLLWLPVMITPFCFCQTREQLVLKGKRLCLLMICFSVGVSAFFLKIDNFTSGGIYHEQINVVGTVDQKSETKYGFYVLLTDVRIGENEARGKLVAYLSPSFGENLQPMDEVLLTGKIDTSTEAFDNGELLTYQIADDIRFEMKNVSECVKVGKNFQLFLFLRQRVQTVLYAGMDETPAAIVTALLLGDTTGIEDGLLENIRWGGVAHIFAVSGLHVGALYAFCQLFMQKTRLKKTPKWLQFILLTTLLLGYAGLCGFSASVIRATVICLVGYVAKLLGLETDFLQSIGAAAIIVLLLSPTALFEVGFLLSFAACLGLALLSKPIEKFFYSIGGLIKTYCIKWFFGGVKARPRPPQSDDDTAPLEMGQRVLRACVSFLSASCAAQIMTAPILLISFDYLSGWGLLLNCIFVPLLTMGFSILLLFALVACLLPTAFSAVILYVPSVVWSALLLMFETIDFSSFALTNVALSGGGVVSYYAGWQFLSDKWNLTRKQRFVLAIACFCAFAATMYAMNC